MKEKEKKITRILRIFMMLLTCILIALFFGIMILVSDMQGTARVVNYAGLVRGKTQQIIKLENAQRPQDEMIREVDAYIDGLRYGSDMKEAINISDHLQNNCGQHFRRNILSEETVETSLLQC